MNNEAYIVNNLLKLNVYFDLLAVEAHHRLNQSIRDRRNMTTTSKWWWRWRRRWRRENSKWNSDNTACECIRHPAILSFRVSRDTAFSIFFFLIYFATIWYWMLTVCKPIRTHTPIYNRTYCSSAVRKEAALSYRYGDWFLINSMFIHIHSAVQVKRHRIVNQSE